MEDTSPQSPSTAAPTPAPTPIPTAPTPAPIPAVPVKRPPSPRRTLALRFAIALMIALLIVPAPLLAYYNLTKPQTRQLMAQLDSGSPSPVTSAALKNIDAAQSAASRLLAAEAPAAGGSAQAMERTVRLADLREELSRGQGVL
ncbi:hypothetical protein QWJ34_21670 [Saccharibacillus sp. CPCC 101409]|uniref:hypothetical protein n=1 Tax=Saccharibacillus sp. CPCC 101409 TaxID=3058041 RepID=UPI002673FD5A|nr:hypothetical protein [Saccharibacillus sp. CPCC 101409]MDO3412388.1 hypothetical protein [Saccharibacillus sp. CPCC 101409]